MLNPFKFVSDSFKDQFQVRFTIGSPDGSTTLSLLDEHGTVAQRLLSVEQLSDPAKLEQTIQSIRFGLAIDRGQGLSCLEEMSSRRWDGPVG
ncbi:DUF3509 domain-containing protein [Zestomonas thermotolerans]|jgi:hypothetical protein|uniref:DUF3509 domain-containing protein n=1 Tax=Zestomonas thermotolerans TaxID=157784 RepID=UPI000361FC5E|nr:DUF3509 domain-containing protein [Pseudomonas thermotolerans]MBO2508985.1 DUF3509 domain-containing protein [Gammaproteobacteria bacterium]